MRIVTCLLLALLTTTPTWAGAPLDREVEAAARNFRIATYEAFRTQRDEYNLRIDAGNEAIRRFTLASDDEGRELICRWFVNNTTTQQASLPEIPEIALADAKNTEVQAAANDQQPREIGAKQTDRDKYGLVITDYKSNPRFHPKFPPNATPKTRNSTAQSLTDALRNPTGLLNSLGSSLLGDGPKRDEANSVDDPFAPVTSDETTAVSVTSESIGRDTSVAPTDSQPGSRSSLAALNQSILDLNLSISLLEEDVQSTSDTSVEFLATWVDRLDAANATYFQIAEQKQGFSDDEQLTLTAVTSLEGIATRLITLVHQLAARIAMGQLDDADGLVQQQLDDYRLRINQVLTFHAI